MLKKILKSVVVVFIVCAVLVGGLLAFYYFGEKNKVAKVLPISAYGMDSYWGDDIQSYGMVTADKAQIIYVAKTEKITGINVSEGQHVTEGDVLMTVDKETIDLKGKALEVQQAKQNLAVEINKLNRLLKTTPVPDANRIYSGEVEGHKNYVSESVFKASGSITCHFETEDGTVTKDVSYSDDDKVCTKEFDHMGKLLIETYYDEHGMELDEKLKLEGDDLADTTRFSQVDTNDIYTWVRKLEYFDGETERYLGCDTFSESGEQIMSFEPQTGYTAQQLQEEIDSRTESVKKQDLSVKRLANEYDHLLKTANTGEVVAKVSGTVSKLQDKDNINYNKPFLTVTATDEYFITGTIGEYYLDKIKVGDIVSITSWENNASADAKIISISDTPADNGDFYGGEGNSNSSVYEFKASFDRNAGIELGAAVNITISSGEEEKGVYVEQAFIRKDATGNYVMRMNSDGNLEKCYVKVGKNLWGWYTEIKSGISADDYLAFPYANGEKEGIPCEVVESIDEI